MTKYTNYAHDSADRTISDYTAFRIMEVIYHREYDSLTDYAQNRTRLINIRGGKNISLKEAGCSASAAMFRAFIHASPEEIHTALTHMKTCGLVDFKEHQGPHNHASRRKGWHWYEYLEITELGGRFMNSYVELLEMVDHFKGLLTPRARKKERQTEHEKQKLIVS
jgi:hypothetical protein